MRISNKAAQEYYFILKSIFPKVTYEEGRFLKEFKTSLIEFTLAHPHCTYETLEEEFETPQDILYEFFNMQDTLELSQSIKKQKTKRYMLQFLVMVILVSLLAYFVLLIYVKGRINQHIPDHLTISIVQEDIDNE